MLLGPERVQAAQVIKQADVLMLHHLVPDAVAPGSLVPNLAFYEPRTAHGSSLSPSIHAGLLARAGRHAEAMEALRMASRIDLDNLTGSTGGGLHLATMGGLWQSLAMGVLGLRPRDGALTIDPCVPPPLGDLSVEVTFRGSRVSVRANAHTVEVEARPPALVCIGEGGFPARVARARFAVERGSSPTVRE